MDLFSSKSLKDYLDKKQLDMKAKIELMSDEEILNCDIKDMSSYYANLFYIEPIVFYDETIERKMEQVQITKYDSYDKISNSSIYYVDGVKIQYIIYFSGFAELLECQPSTFTLSRYRIDSLTKPAEDYLGNIVISFEYSNSSLKSYGKSMNEHVQNNFEREYEKYKKMVGYVNKDVNSYNRQLEENATQILEKRKEKADTYDLISKTLQIPLMLNCNAPNIIPIKITKERRNSIEKPKIKANSIEYCISDTDYNNINNIVYMNGTTMEKTARTYCQNNEEELRDHLLATLNTHYESVTGETFRKIGKTDIQIEFENKAAYIGECKIWYGEKKFEEAVQQVLNYSTWRDIKISIIIFNMDNISFHKIIEKIESWAKIHTLSYKNIKKNYWACKYHRNDMNIDINLTILAFDLYIDKNQVKDSRF